MSEQSLERILEKKLDRRIYLHSLGVAQSAMELARRYGESREKAYRAGLVHDFGKRYGPEELRLKARRLGLKLDAITLQEPQLLHAPVGAFLVRNELKIEDMQIVRAVAYHTTGSPRLDLLGRLIYLADFIEKGRSYPGVDRLRELAFSDLQRALLTAVENTIRRVLSRGSLLHPLSVAFRNDLLKKIGEDRR